ncbi:hypothetical protein KSP40_PGU006402 [Platanthera guangdongensis]|uniref:Uncharacterized protein n=1 Tax=Platanthera guangdongensis TaxID=2320717 RepID=A0ABR2MTM4_9ASPA
MVGSSSRAQSVDRFYTPPAIRRQLEKQKKHQQELQNPSPPRNSSPTPAARTMRRPSPLRNHPPMDNRIEQEASPSSMTTASSSSSSLPATELPAGNLDRFLQSTTPIVPALHFPKMTVMESQLPYFALGDLWESFKEWSAYGAGVPLVLNDSDSVVQYYVPYLSAIQLFVNPSAPSLVLRQPDEESGKEPYLNTSNESSSSTEAERLITNRPYAARSIGPQASSSGDGEASCSSIHPIFEYMETEAPHGRAPLVDKISSLASKFPDLKTYNSCDLLSSSWMSVAWYPIYRIPIGSTLRDLDACFLTFHLLSTPVKSNVLSEALSPHIMENKGGQGLDDKFSIPIFGLASYRLKGSIWTSSGNHEGHLASSLFQAAANWLHLRQVYHPDFRFFCQSWR